MRSAASVTPLERSGPHSERMQQHAYLTRFDSGAALAHKSFMAITDAAIQPNNVASRRKRAMSAVLLMPPKKNRSISTALAIQYKAHQRPFPPTHNRTNT